MRNRFLIFYGWCDAIYKKVTGPKKLFETISYCLLSNLDRDS